MPPRCLIPGSWLSIAAAAQQRSSQVAPFLIPRLHDFKHPRRSSLNPLHTASSSLPSPPPPFHPPHTPTFSSFSTSTNDTIFALATGASRAGVAIIRISGPHTPHIYHSLCLTSRLKPYRSLPPSHKLVLRNIHHPSTHELLDSGAGVIHFPSNASYTGEESLELHVHGGLATVSGVLDALGMVGEGVRMAEPGEFTRRAFEGGRLDLAEAEAVHGLVVAETAVQRQVALQGTQGLQTKRYEEMRGVLLRAMAMVEALIDFADEDGVEEGTWQSAKASVDQLATLLRSELGVSSIAEEGREEEGEKQIRHVGEILTTGVRLAIYGPPNAGKSSLLNSLADRNAAIVSDNPGTTRDVLQVHLDLAGYKVIVYDTAGIRSPPTPTSSPSDQIEQIGIERAKDVVAAADLALLVQPATQPLNPQTILRPHTYTDTDPDLIFYNKCDLLPNPAALPPTSPQQRSWHGSVLTNTGLPTLITDLAALISRKYALRPTDPPLITHSRHRSLLHHSLLHITTFQHLAQQDEVDLVLAAEHLKYAARQVGKVTGRDVSPDEILGRIFSTFCIGK
ncbi:related to MSS1-mitochondrial GTPase involved in expression of COX1 [Sporisorium scitamineum]|uniref:Related to MSS1-mitochondrial GTPase involved in expression of COX1 n=1 Tax=Sporisorium scitamineum TaxID=49012 RepID=A0A0F7SA13_9BASI|nr:related to MSS1-mitochondrial GTPase involved in expression of COX1 [Sporisorium scitamineum]CDW97468.1 hypothetical protein [Sporisorium scitamineum]